MQESDDLSLSEGIPHRLSTSSEDWEYTIIGFL